MKNILLTSLLILSPTLQAKGFECEAYCIVLDSANSILNVMGEINTMAGTSRKETHHLLKKTCEQMKNQAGLPGAALLVDVLDFYSEAQHSSVGSYSSYSSYSSRASAGVSTIRRAYSNYYLSVAHSASHETTSSFRNHEGRKLDIKLTPSSESTACVETDNVADGEIPYLGNLEIL